MGRTGYRLTSSISNESLSEMDEFDIWNSGSGPDPRRPGSGWRVADMKKGLIPTKRSMPVKVPEWSKILKEESDHRRSSSSSKRLMMMVGDDDDDEEEDRIPPHEVVARRARSRMVASFSVHEGIGRTLKGRDLSRVRNAIWDQIGFQD